jgi:hypothetical protein
VKKLTLSISIFAIAILFAILLKAAPPRTADFIAKFDSAGNPAANSVMFDNGTNVGIGTTGPNTPLTVWTPSTTAVQEGIRINNPVGFAGNGNGSSLVFSQDRSPSENNINATIQGVQEGANTSERAYLGFSTRSNSNVLEKMRIAAEGNVGIGTTNPTQKLEVAGTIRSTAAGPGQPPSSGGFMFPDGTTQTTATLRGPQGPQGPVGPPVKSVSICTSQGPVANPGSCSCAGREISRLTNQFSCTATSDTGTCTGSGTSDANNHIVFAGSCCVCAAQ